MKHYIMKQLSAITSPYQGVVANRCTNGNLVIVSGGIVKYSDDAGVTWKTPTGHETPIDVCPYVDGNTVYLLYTDIIGNYKVYRSTNSGATYSQYGSTIVKVGYESAIGITKIGSTLWIAIHNQGNTIAFLKYTADWVDGGFGDIACDIQGLWGVKLFVDGNLIVFGASDSNDIAYLISYNTVTGALTDPAYSFTDIDGLGNNLIVNWVVDSFEKIGNYWFFCGESKTDLNVSNGYVLMRSASYSSGWTIVANERIMPIYGTSPRVWGIVVNSNKIYVSHNNGGHFFPIAYKSYNTLGTLLNSAWVSGVEITNSDRGLGVFDPTDTDYFYTFQEATWTDIFVEESLKLYAGSEPGIFKGLMDSNDKTRFVDGMVIPIYDDAGNIMFEGKIAFTEQDEGLFTFQAVEISEELERIKPTGTYTAQTATVILADLIDTHCTFCYQSASITSSATTYTIDFKGEKSLAQILDEFANLEDYIWYKHGDGKIAFNDGTTASGVTYDAATDDYAEPKITSEGYRIANRIEGRGKVETDGPVFYAADDLDDQTRNGVWVFKFTQPTWGYDEVKACADNLLAARKSWSDIFSMLIEETLTLRPGTTVVMVNFSTDFGIDDGTYIVMAIEHPGDATSRIVLNNASISSKDWAREQEYANNAMKDLYTKADIAESGGSSTDIPFESEDEMLARIIRHATSEANAVTFIYDFTHKVLMWTDSSGNLNMRPTGSFIFNQNSGNATVYIKATGGVGTEDAWLYIDGEDDSAVLFQENSVTKAYIKWDKGDADLILQSDGDIALNPTGGIVIAAGKGITGEGIPPCQIIQGEAGFVAGTNLFYADLSDNNANVNTCFYVAKGGSFKVRFLYEVTNAETVSGLLYLGDATSGQDIAWDLATGVNCDLTAAIANVMYPFDSGAYTIADGALVTFKWAKDAAGTAAKYIYIYGVVLVRQ